MIFPEKIARWCSPGAAPTPAGASALGGPVPTRRLGLLIGVRVLVGGRATLLKGFGERFRRFPGLELREPLQLSVLVRCCCSSGLFSGSFSLVSLPRAVKFDLLVILVELGLIFLLMVALLGRLLLAVLLVNLRSCAGELISFAEAGEDASTLRADGAVVSRQATMR